MEEIEKSDLVHSTVQDSGAVIDPAWQLVPKEPAAEMVLAGQEPPFSAGTYLTAESMIARYRAMLAAAPFPPPPSDSSSLSVAQSESLKQTTVDSLRSKNEALRKGLESADFMLAEALRIATLNGDRLAAGHFDQIRDVVLEALSLKETGNG
jgi:hypothetical protein